MQTRILTAATLILLTVMTSRNVFGQIYDDDGNRMFNMNISRAGDDSSGIATIIYKDGPVYVAQFKGDKILNFSVDGRNVPLDGLGKYQAVIDSIKVRMKEAEEQAERDRVQSRLDRQQAERDRMQAELDRQQAERDRQRSITEREQADRERAQEERARAQELEHRLQVDREREQVELDRQQAERDRVQAREEREQADRNREQAELDRRQVERDRAQAERDRAQAERDRIRAEEDRKIVDSLTGDLVADGVVPDRNSVHSITLNADEVIVNGKRLPEAMEKKYISKYVKQRGFSMSRDRD
jgi:colicin import membrane protein